MKEVVRGKVSIFNAVKGIGFIKGVDGFSRFFHQTDLAVPGFRAIAIGREVKFTSSILDNRPVATGINPMNGTGIQVASPLPKGIGLEGVTKDRVGIVILRVDAFDRIYANEDLFPFGEILVAPSVWGTDGSFRAFRVGGRVKGFTLRLPQPTALRAFVALDPDKRILPPVDGQIQLPPGSYILSLEDNGALDIQTIGQRYQAEKGGGNWVVLEHRFRHTFNLQEDLASQIPTSGLERDNDGFLPGIAQAATLLKQGVMAS